MTDDKEEVEAEVTGLTDTSGEVVTQYGEAYVEKVNENRIMIEGSSFTRITPE